MESAEDEMLDVDPVFLGLTRPTTKLGIPDYAFIMEIAFVFVMFLTFDNIWLLLAILPIHGILYLTTVNDPNKLRCIGAWLRTNGRCLNRSYWKSTSFSPLTIRKR